MPASGRDQELFELISKMQYCNQEDVGEDDAADLQDEPATEADEMRQIWGLTTEPSSSAAGSQQPVEIKAEVAEERGTPGDAHANLQQQLDTKRQEVMNHLRGRLIQIMESDEAISLACRIKLTV